MRVWTAFVWYVLGIGAVPCERNNEPSGSVKGGISLLSEKAAAWNVCE